MTNAVARAAPACPCSITACPLAMVASARIAARFSRVLRAELNAAYETRKTRSALGNRAARVESSNDGFVSLVYGHC